jgi:hypothetical protein
MRTLLSEPPSAMRMRGIALAIGAAIAVALVSGCASGSAHRSPAAGPKATDAAGTMAPDVADAAAAGERLRAATFSGHYSSHSSSAQPLDGAVLAIYKRGPDVRFDFSLDGSGGDVAFSEILIADGDFLCYKDAHVFDAVLGGMLGAEATPVTGAPACTRVGGSSSGALLGVGVFADQLAGGHFLSTAPRTIAGITGACFAGTEQQNDEPEEVCVSSEGALLYLASGADQRDEIRATSIDHAVDEAVFSLPYPVSNALPTR